MISANIDTILFDLDGTLLPMSTEAFPNAYFKLLAQKAAPYGYKPQALIAAVWKGTKAMIQNDGSTKNDQRFWDAFAEELGRQVLDLRPVFDRFYAEEFHGAKTATGENPLAQPAVAGLKAKGYQVILATNPLFPAVGVATRLSWVGLAPEDFLAVTSYEGSSYCKPNPDYYRELLAQTGKRPEQCLMVGNDVAEDFLAAKQAGLEGYLITGCLENSSGVDISNIPQGSFRDFMAYAGLY